MLAMIRSRYYNLATLQMTKKDRMDIFVVFLVCF